MSATAAALLVLGLAPGAGASTQRAPVGGADVVRTGPARGLSHSTGVGPLTNVRSTNWAGYVDTGHTFSYVHASWRVPRVTCTSTDAVASFWVGVDGYHSKNVEQAGTLAYCHGGKVTYSTWWEMYPAVGVQVVGSTVRPGDIVTAAVAISGHSYTLKVTDRTTKGNSFTKKTTCATCRNASVEWIAERPGGQRGLYPLARFGHIDFYGTRVGVGGDRGSISAYTHDAVTMINGHGATMASVSALQRSGNQFVATWLRMQ